MENQRIKRILPLWESNSSGDQNFGPVPIKIIENHPRIDEAELERLMKLQVGKIRET
jgi:hypothetical protein